ncbi:MAG: Crp/Fnr family transcriptional regulator [Hyphomicrobiaceae bacterium]
MTIARSTRQSADRGPAARSGEQDGYRGIRLDLRRRQRIVFKEEAPDQLYRVERGCITLDAVLPDDRRQVLLVLYPGDLISRSASPPVPGIGLTAAVASTLTRLPGETIDTAADGVTEMLRLHAAVAQLSARSTLHAMAIGRLTSEERVATLLTEIALFCGRAIQGSYSFEMPLSRDDMADYLALNPDTLSRLMSRLRARKLIAMPTRNRAIVRDLDALMALTPLAKAVLALRGSVERGATAAG